MDNYFSEDPAKIKQQILETKEKLFDSKSVVSEFYKTKYNLLNIYLMNYILLSETEEKEVSPMHDNLVRITVLLEKLLEVEEDLERILKETSQECKKSNIKNIDGKRPITDEIMENNPLNKKKVQNNPRKKYKEKFYKMKEEFKPESNKKID
ncbi:hypothetical protein NGRA_0284 [Nosema granulosis]|uniref:Sas10 C-terminal domain-containing protein n=1 Tax=Nosema granulosis TaxID=83296 RepID=A0A9P6L0A6_9MICR|nr:hypothetical protein NGRA_0284 [Nosema granulosis]